MTTDERPGARRCSEEDLEEIGQKGNILFGKLRDLVWKDNDGKFIAIHVDTGEYAVGSSSFEARQALRRGREPDGRIYTRKLSDEPEYGLAARILAGDMAASARK